MANSFRKNLRLTILNDVDVLLDTSKFLESRQQGLYWTKSTQLVKRLFLMTTPWEKPRQHTEGPESGLI